MAPRKPRALTPEQIKAVADRAEGIGLDDAEQPSAGGRPPDYKPEFVEQAKKLCELGATDIELADFFGVSGRTIYRWQIKYPKFCQALKAGKSAADERVERSLFHKAVGYTHDAVKIMQYEGSPVIVPYREHVAPDTTAGIFWLKNRRPEQWRDKTIQEHTGKDGGPIETAEVSARDLIDRRISGLASRGTTQGNPGKPH